MRTGVGGSDPLERGLLDQDPTLPLNTLVCVGSRNRIVVRVWRGSE
jgi:hypothetical protein